MSAEDNRSEPNLVLMCLFHSRAIDESEKEYPADLLRQWKAEAEAGHDGVEPPITDVEINEIRQYIVAETFVQAEIIHLGGRLGGGGGAIGGDAVGGRGGDIVIADLHPPTSKPETASIQPFFGEGFSEGYDGQDGGTTAFGDGTNGVLLAAGGGGGGFVGTGDRITSDRLRVSSLLLVDGFDLRDGLVYVLGGAWNRLAAPELPLRGTAMVLTVIEAGGAPPGEYSIHVAAFGPDEARVARVSFPVTVSKTGQVFHFVRHAPLDLNLTHEGVHVITVDSDAGEMARIEFAVVLNEDP